MRKSTLLLPVIAALLVPAHAQRTLAPSAASFRSIELRGGGVVTIRHGPARQVTVPQANPGRPIRADGERLVIEECRRPCPRGHRIEVEIVTPELARVAVADGGRIELRGDFPRQAAIAASVSSGGTIDIRPLEAASVAAAVEHGGRILARPGRMLAATVSNGGNVTYWGDPRVTSSIRHGGVVERGDPADLARPAAQLGGLSPPPLPAIPPALPRPSRKH